MDRKFEASFEEYKLLADICREYFGHYLKATSLYLIVIGAILKFFLDSANGNAKIGFWTFGLIVNFFACLVTIYAFKQFKPLLKKSAQISQKLETEDYHYPAAINIGKALLLMIILITIAWILLLLII